MTAAPIHRKLETVARRQGGKRAITFLRGGRPETALTYAGLQRGIERFAGLLADCGVRRGDRVVVLTPKSLAAVVAHFGVLAAGAVAVPLNPGFKKPELAYFMRDADPALLLLDPSQKAKILAIDPRARCLELPAGAPYAAIGCFHGGPAAAPRPDLTPDDPALIIYTSGTTGHPKGAVLTHGNLAWDAGSVIAAWEIGADDVLCHALPLFHIHGLCFALHTALLSGAGVRLLDRFDPRAVAAELCRRDGDVPPCSVFMAVPAMYIKLLDHFGDRRPDVGHLRLLASGSAPLPVGVFDRIAAVFGREPVEREGMSETGMNFSNPLRGRRLAGSIGRPLPGVEVRVVDPETGADVPPGRVGELWLKSPGITRGYWRKPRETAEAFADGWFRTGDLGKVDAAGYYHLTDRLKHIIISGGENVSAKEVETVIDRLEGVEASAVVGKPDDRWGEKVVAAVVRKKGAFVTAEDVTAHCRVHLHDWKCPREVVFIAEIPRNTMGKVLKDAVKRFFGDGGSGEAP